MRVRAEAVVRARRGMRKRKERNRVIVARWVGGVDVGEWLGGDLVGVTASGVLKRARKNYNRYEHIALTPTLFKRSTSPR